MHLFPEECEMSIKNRVISLLSVGGSHFDPHLLSHAIQPTFIQGGLHLASRTTRFVKSPWSSLLTLSFPVSRGTMVSLPQGVVENATLEVSATT
jgi:hypothetical protein